uniref:C2 domain-containing protein n=1 Tax=Heterorhabditis bacteriophora TaxID=37862 RepID=A0A1I7X8Z0_HETBA
MYFLAHLLRLIGVAISALFVLDSFSTLVLGAENVTYWCVTIVASILLKIGNAGCVPFVSKNERAPAISRRNLTLPEISPPNLLSVPTEAEATGQNRNTVMKRFWGGSPSPRTSSPKNMGSPHGVTVIAPTPPPHSLMPQVHFKEVIGSPAPRNLSPLGSPLSIIDSSLSTLSSKGQLPTTEVAPPTPTAVTPSSPLCEMRRQMFQNVERLSRNISNNNLLRPIDLRETQRRQSYTSDETGAGQVPSVSGLIPSRRLLAADSHATSDPQMRLPEDELSSSSIQRLDVSNNNRRRVSMVSLASSHRTRSQDSGCSKGAYRPSDIKTKNTHPKGWLTPSNSKDVDTLSLTSTYTECSSVDNSVKSVSIGSQASGPTRTFLGEIQLKLSYDVRLACLNVYVIQCRSLPHFGTHRPNPYVKAFLLPRNANEMILKHKTTPRKNVIDPHFDEQMKFPHVSKSELEQRDLLVAVWHKDIMSQNALLGEAVLCLRDHPWQVSDPAWYPLEAKQPMASAVAERKSRGVRVSFRFNVLFTILMFTKAVLQRKKNIEEEELQYKTSRSSRATVELEHNLRKPKPKRFAYQV